jgi:4-cresol dehydrogenase (hydroxylating)
MRRDFVRMLTLLRPVYDLLKGIPTDSTIASAYWRKRDAAPKDGQCDPDRDGCGLLWCAPVVPMTGAALSEVTALASSVVLESGFEPQMSISLATDRMAICVITITYDRSEAGADEAAMSCYRSLTERLHQRGYPLYRRNVAAMQVASEAPAYAGLLRDLKSALDPNAILAPGRYEPAAAVAHPSAVRRGA